jgi:HAD superfamily hydrolase (TIGR01459 family)
VLTSGEATRQALLSPPDDWFATIGPKVLHIGPERDRPTLAGLPFEIADIPEEADFVLNTGPDDHNPLEVSAYEAVLLAARKVGLKMICANPDLEIVRDGVRIPCAGALALRYEELGGDVRAFGKPDAAIYRPVLEMLGLPKERVLAVGDSLRTDIAGAKAAGIDSCWVLGGIHAAELGSDQGLIRGAATEAGLAPVACVPAFVLG